MLTVACVCCTLLCGGLLYAEPSKHVTELAPPPGAGQLLLPQRQDGSSGGGHGSRQQRPWRVSAAGRGRGRPASLRGRGGAPATRAGTPTARSASTRKMLSPVQDAKPALITCARARRAGKLGAAALLARAGSAVPAGVERLSCLAEGEEQGHPDRCHPDSVHAESWSAAHVQRARGLPVLHAGVSQGLLKAFSRPGLCRSSCVVR